MDRRTFLGGIGAFALAPTLPLQNVESKILQKWVFRGQIIGGILGYELYKHVPHVNHGEITVFYDHIAWRGMNHNWIAYCECDGKDYAAQYEHPIDDDVSTFKLMCMDYTVVDYPNKKHWDDLHKYGHFVANKAQETLRTIHANYIH